MEATHSGGMYTHGEHRQARRRPTAEGAAGMTGRPCPVLETGRNAILGQGPAAVSDSRKTRPVNADPHLNGSILKGSGRAW